MSEKEFSEGQRAPRVPEEHLDEEAAPGNDDEREIEVAQEAEEIQEARIRPLETESRDSGHDSPLEGATGGSRDSGHDSPLEGAVGGILEDDYGVTFSPRERRRIKSGKEDLFRKFFSKEYDQALAPILDRHRHSARRQRVRTRHASEGSRLSDPNPLGCLQDAGTSSGAVLNQAGAIIGKSVPREEIPDYERFGTEFGQSLPLTARREGSERSLTSIATALIGDVYGGTFSRPPSDDSRGLSPGSSFPSFSSRPPTAASDNLKTSPPLDSASPEGDQLYPTPADSENVAQGKPTRHRRFGVVNQPLPVRSKSALAGFLEYCTDDDGDSEQKRKVSKDMSVCSEPLPQRKISKDSSVGYNEEEDETVAYPELAHSLESDNILPMPDIDPAAVENLQANLGALTISSDVASDAAEQNAGQETENSELNPNIALSSSPDVEVSQQPPERRD